MSNKFYNDSGFWSGVVLYYIFVWLITFYPAFILSFTLQRFIFDVSGDEGESAFFGLVAMIVGTIVILFLAKCRQYLIVLTIYLLTLWPFLCILAHYWNCESGQEFPLPLDWWPLW